MSPTPFAFALVLLATPLALAQTQATYEGSSYGTGSGKCPGYKMGILVTVAGDQVDGVFQQEGRTQRDFHAKAGTDGSFKTEARVGGGGTMSVSGSVGANGGRVLLDGYCRFETALARKP